MHTPSIQQQDFYDWIDFGEGSAVLAAKAGAGKTSSLIEGLKLMKGSVFFGAYNKKIADEIQAKLPQGSSAKVQTMHAAGFASLKAIAPNCKLENYKCRDIYRTIAGYDKQLRSLEGSILNLVSYAKQAGIGIVTPVSNDDAWENLIDHFNVDTNGSTSMVIFNAKKVLAKSTVICETSIDFEDMIYYPLLKNAVKAKYDWVLIDEGQDTNVTRRLLSLALLKKDGRLICVGDNSQAIYGFTGADHNAMELIKEATNAITLPLSVSFRCPKSVVKEAQKYVSDIEHHEDAPEGVVRSLSKSDDIFKEIRKGDVILCRYNAPLVDLVYRFILNGIPAKIEGKDVGGGLKTLANKWVSPKDFSEFKTKLYNYQEKEIAKYEEHGKQYLIEPLQDRVQCLLTIIKRIQAKITRGSPSDLLCAEIDSIFGDVATEGYVTLSSIHKSKGCEFIRVYFLTTDPSKRKMQDWEITTEKNLIYVAITRAMYELVYVPADKKAKNVKAYND